MYKVITQPTFSAVSLDELKYQLNIESDYTRDDIYLQMLISASQSYVEHHIQRILCTQEVQIRIHYYKPGRKHNGVHHDRGVYVPSPAADIVSIHSVTDGVETELDAEDFTLDDFTIPTVLAPANDYEWPECDHFIVVLEVGTTAALIDNDLKLAIMILAADAYENRVEQVRDRDNNVNRYLRKYRLTEFVDYASTSNTLQVR